jgi:L-fuculose-phosphate aldolase
MPLGPTPASEIIAAGRILADHQMVAGSGGNLSVRLDEKRVLITRSGVCKGRLAESDLIVIDLEGNLVSGSGAPSSESRMHLFAYRERPDVQACVHSHPSYSTAFAVAGVEMPTDVLPEVVVYIGDIPLTEYAAPGTDEVPQSLQPHIQTSNAFLLANHGLLTLGRDMEEALNRHETVEQYAKILLLAQQLGEVVRIPQRDLTRLNEIRARHSG